MEKINLTLANDLLTTKIQVVKAKPELLQKQRVLSFNTAIFEIDQKAAKAIEAQTKEEEVASKNL